MSESGEVNHVTAAHFGKRHGALLQAPEGYMKKKKKIKKKKILSVNIKSELISY
jgi:hypothetical protein